MKVAYTGQCCVDCLMIIANGELGQGDSAADGAHNARITKHLGLERGQHVVLNSSEETDDEFSWHACEACGSTLGGSRHGFAILEPEVQS